MKTATIGSIDLAESPLPFDALPTQFNAGVPVELWFSVLPAHPSNELLVQHRANGRERPAVRAWRDSPDPVTGAQRFRVRMPPLAPDETAEYLPLVRRAGLVVQTLTARSTRGVAMPSPQAEDDSARACATGSPRFQWASEFLGAFTVKLINPPESFGPGSDGMHITYHIECGEIRGPKINGKVSGGDWMLLRRDGVGVAESRISYETDNGARLLSRYYGIFDLGPNGYARAVRNEFDPQPPLVLAPQFITTHPNYLWLNRLQCIAVGRANMSELVARLDIYAIRTGQPLPSSGLPCVDTAPLIGEVH